MALSMPAIMKTTAARLSALYLLLFAICAVLLVFYMTSLSARMLTGQTQETINDEVLGLARVYQRGGLPLLVRVVERRSRQPGANLYLIADDVFGARFLWRRTPRQRFDAGQQFGECVGF